ncbi:MAG: transglutaminase-like domain-containing protein [Betaproteobacteria bacterium]
MTALLAGCATYFRDAGAPPPPQPLTLQSWPHRELWTGIVFNGDKVGFTRREVRPAADAPGRFEIESEAVLRLRFLGIDKRISLRALDRVRPDLTLERFRYEHEIDGSPLKVEGSSDGKVLQFAVHATGSREERRLDVQGPLYPSSALTLLPAVRGLAVGRASRFSVFEGETQAIAEVEQDVVAYETSELFEGPAFKVATRMLGLDTTTWIAPDGKPVFELAMRGVLISALETESAARRYLVEATLNKRDALVDFSLVRSPPVDSPRSVAGLELELDGVPRAFAVPSEAGQACRRDNERLACSIDRSSVSREGDTAKYLKPTLAAPSNLGEIAGLARSIAAHAASADEKIRLLVAWMDANIAKEAVDSFTAADVLRTRRAECQGHAYLFAAFARSLGIPTRVVNGLVYSEAHGGFLYHTWNEAWIAGSGWRPVDATFGQPLADATHLKLIEGETPAELLPLVGLVGRLKVSTARPTARW